MADVTTRPSNMMISIGKCKDSPIIIRHIADIHTTNLNATTMQGQVKTMEQKEILKGQHKKLQAPQAQQLLQNVGSVPGWPPQPAVRGHLPRGTLGPHLVQAALVTSSPPARPGCPSSTCCSRWRSPGSRGGGRPKEQPRETTVWSHEEVQPARGL